MFHVVAVIANPKDFAFTNAEPGVSIANKVRLAIVIGFTNTARRDLINTVSIVANHVNWALSILDTTLKTSPLSSVPLVRVLTNTGSGVAMTGK